MRFPNKEFDTAIRRPMAIHYFQSTYHTRTPEEGEIDEYGRSKRPTPPPKPKPITKEGLATIRVEKKKRPAESGTSKKQPARPTRAAPRRQASTSPPPTAQEKRKIRDYKKAAEERAAKMSKKAAKQAASKPAAAKSTAAKASKAASPPKSPTETRSKSRSPSPDKVTKKKAPTPKEPDRATMYRKLLLPLIKLIEADDEGAFDTVTANLRSVAEELDGVAKAPGRGRRRVVDDDDEDEEEDDEE
ncbi:hypothetical protein LTR37_007804 [Vermiconidia calcicola]|uniref:Uncharacterized protein n=1 Tax=Vermiconidia calcicola TaxID=1690605 RepID=A0ACC3NCL6_9PEZI|nr:hypothetical protein LTR37_007804 [Vermiconidia calcicola]